MSVLGMGKAVLRGIYGLHKLAPVRPCRVTVISRQSNTPSVDIRLLKEELRRQGVTDVSVLCRTLDGGLAHKAGYLLHMIGPQMHAIATSRVVVLDSYCIAVSILPHRPELHVIQMWHAMGALKKFGRSILGQEEGSSRALAEEMDMHRGYDAILTSSEACRPYFAEAFGYEEDCFWILPLPRTDLLRDSAYMRAKKEEILTACPELQGKQIILYAPTMRKTEDDHTKPLALAKALKARNADSVLVFSPHPVVREQFASLEKEMAALGACVLPAYSTLDLLAVCDAFVSDYSAAVYEAAAAGKPVYLYAYDLDRYEKTRGFYTDYMHEMPDPPRRTAEEVAEAIAAGTCDPARVQAFSEKYIAPAAGCARELAARIKAML